MINKKENGKLKKAREIIKKLECVVLELDIVFGNIKKESVYGNGNNK